MSSVLATGVIAVMVSAGTVVGLQSSGVLDDILNSQPKSELSADGELSLEELDRQLGAIESDLDRKAASSKLNETREDLETYINAKLDEMEASASSSEVVTPPVMGDEEDAAAETGSNSGMTRGELEELINSLIEQRHQKIQEDNAKRIEEKRDEKAVKDRANYVIKITKYFEKEKKKHGYADYQITQGIEITMAAYDKTKAYTKDVQQRTKEGQEVSPEERKTEYSRIVDERNIELALLFGEEKSKEMVKRLPRQGATSHHRSMGTSRDGGSRRTPSTPKGGGR